MVVDEGVPVDSTNVAPSVAAGSNLKRSPSATILEASACVLVAVKRWVAASDDSVVFVRLEL